MIMGGNNPNELKRMDTGEDSHEMMKLHHSNLTCEVLQLDDIYQWLDRSSDNNDVYNINQTISIKYNNQ